MTELKNREDSQNHKIKVEKENATQAAAKLNGKTIKITAKAGQGGRLFGSVTAKEVAETIKKDLGVTVDKRKITVNDIKAFGTYKAQAKFYQGITADFSVMVSES